MQIDIKTSSVTQLRNTFSHVARRLGGDKPASRYQEATFDMQPEVNFHYRPIWEPQFELYDKKRTRVVMRDWYAFTDPRQYYYGTYTLARSRQQETMERNIAFVEQRGLLRNLNESVALELAQFVLPLRHIEWAANMNNCHVTAYGWGAAITQATMYHTMDRLGIAQFVSKIGLLIDGNSGTSLDVGKKAWCEDPIWQPLRRTIENSLVVHDWFEVFLLQNLVLDGLLYPLYFQHYDARFSAANGPTLSMITGFMTTWFDETRRWVDATIKTAASESEANRDVLGEWFNRWSSEFVAAIEPLGTRLLGDQASVALSSMSADLRARAQKLGVQV